MILSFSLFLSFAIGSRQIPKRKKIDTLRIAVSDIAIDVNTWRIDCFAYLSVAIGIVVKYITYK